MEFIHNEYRIPSKTGGADIYVQSIVPSGIAVKAILQISHGMAEYTDRYIEVAEFLAANGYAVFMDDHEGHGKSINKEEDLGYFCDKDGNEKIVDDLYSVSELAKKNYPGVKLILWGHSMGSFMARRYTEKYPKSADAAIFCGTAGANPAAAIGAAMANAIKAIKGKNHKSPFLNNLAFGAYNKKFEEKTGYEWLSVNEENVTKYVADPLCGYLFSAEAYRDLFNLLASVNTKDWYNAVPKKLPILLIAGEMDPVGNYGKGVTEVYDKLKESGHKNVEMKLYPGLRHEIHNEKERQEVYNDILAFADAQVNPPEKEEEKPAETEEKTEEKAE